MNELAAFGFEVFLAAFDFGLAFEDFALAFVDDELRPFVAELFFGLVWV